MIVFVLNKRLWKIVFCINKKLFAHQRRAFYLFRYELYALYRL